jgi:hypothetical protein
LAGRAYPLRLPTRVALLWRVAVLGMTLGAMAARLWSWSQGEEFRTLSSLVIMALAAPWVLLLHLGFPARAGDQGLRLFDAWGWPHRLAWSDIREVELSRWPYMVFAPALRLRMADGSVRWLPRETQNLAALHALVLARCGPAHPLAQALQTPLYRL